MRILLLSANREPFPEPVFPIGAVYVAHALQGAGAEVRIFDMRHRFHISSLRREIASFRPDRIGISLRNVDNAAYPAVRFYLPSYKALMQAVRACCDAPIILGGSAFSLFPEEIGTYLAADGGVKGEGEKVAEHFKNIIKGQIISRDIINIAEAAFPKNIKELFPGFRRYKTVGIQTARGCPNQCLYCTYPSLEGRQRRARSPETVADEIIMMHKDFGIRNFFIVDSLFNADEDHMIQVLEMLVRLRLPIRFSCYLQPKASRAGIFRLLKKAGCVAVDFGTDSCSPSMLASLRKPFTRDDILKVSLSCREAGIDFCHSLILGGPGETRESVIETVRMMDEIAPRAVIAMTGIRIYPGTEMHRIAIKEGLCETGQSLLEPKFYFSRMGPQKLLESAYESAEGKKNWFFPGKRDWSSTIGYKILNLFYRGGPLWKTFRK
jgi:radical SAM superfamily enzyme YgiQ (UPF0313 family)